MDDNSLLKLYRTFHVLGDSHSLKILFELDRYGDRTFSELRDRLHINPASLSKRLKNLTQIGFITPDTSHDHLHVYYALHGHRRPIKRILESFERLSQDLQ